MPRSGSSRRGWLVTSYAGAAAFFALEAVARVPGEASDLAATDSDQGTTWQIGAAYGLAAGLSPVLRRLRAGRLPPVSGPAGVAVMAAGLALRAWSMRTLGTYYSRALRSIVPLLGNWSSTCSLNGPRATLNDWARCLTAICDRDCAGQCDPLSG